jgi:signal transduction histidine kinase
MRPRHAPTRSLFILLGLVVSLFVGVNVYFQSHTRQIETDALSVATNAAPSIERLTRARAVLRHMEAQTGLAIGEVLDHRPFDRSFFDADDRELHVEIGAYVDLPAYAGERALFRDADQAIDTFERSVDRVLGLLERGEVQAAREHLRQNMRPAATRAATALQRLIDLNAQQVTASGLRILEARGQVQLLSILLQGITVLVAVLLIWLTVRTTRASQRLSDERRRIAELRAEELEQFAGRVAHDLKNPLQSISARMELVKRQGGDESFARLATQVRSMSMMIDGLLEFAMSGAAPQTHARAELGRIVDGVVATVRDEADAQQIDLELAPMPPAALAINAGALTSILANLLRNAIKFTADRPLRRVSLRATEQNGRVRIEVEDTGPGIPPGKEEALFAPFVRLDTSRRVPGLGLGLATVKRLAEASGGAVGVRSRPGEGACFWVELPRVDVPVPRHARQSPVVN